MRMGMCRFTRTNPVSKRGKNLTAAVSLHLVRYTFAQPHQTLIHKNGDRKTTPAMAAGKANRVRTLTDMDGLLEGALPSS